VYPRRPSLLQSLSDLVANRRGATVIPASSGEPPVKLERYGGVEHSIEAMKRGILSDRGAWSPKVRFAAERIVERVSPKDYLSEVLAIRHWVSAHAPYLRDPAHVEWIRDPQALLEAMEASPTGVVRCDCDEISSLIAALWLAVGNQVELVTVAFDRGPASHVFVRCKVPKAARNEWIVCDPVAGSKEAAMLKAFRRFWTYPLN
jgi:hypothetical protein